MKKLFLIILAGSLILTAACTKKEEPVPPTETPAAEETEKPESEASYIELTDAALEDGMNIYKQIVYDKESDEAALGFLGVSLYTDAERDENGDYMWDDGQNYELAVNTENGDFTLIPKTYLQFSDVEFSSFIKMDSGEYTVLVTIPSGASYVITEYTYDKDNNRFSVSEAYIADNINRLETGKIGID